MKFGQLIEYNMRNIFLGNSYTKCDGETNPRFFSEKPNGAYLWMKSLNFFTDYFCYIPHFLHEFWGKIFILLHSIK